MEDAAGAEEVVGGVGGGLRKGPKSQVLCRGNGACVNNVLLIQNIVVERKQKSGALAMRNRSGDRAFEVLPPLGRLSQGGEGVGCVEDGIAKHEVGRPVILG